MLSWEQSNNRRQEKKSSIKHFAHRLHLQAQRQADEITIRYREMYTHPTTTIATTTKSNEDKTSEYVSTPHNKNKQDYYP